MPPDKINAHPAMMTDSPTVLRLIRASLNQIGNMRLTLCDVILFPLLDGSLFNERGL